MSRYFFPTSEDAHAVTVFVLSLFVVQLLNTFAHKFLPLPAPDLKHFTHKCNLSIPYLLLIFLTYCLYLWTQIQINGMPQKVTRKQRLDN